MWHELVAQGAYAGAQACAQFDTGAGETDAGELKAVHGSFGK
ncbi:MULTISPECIES: hypothetical protein [Wolbachia]|nr:MULTISPECIES: hypothetical protein [Wolbachia]